jgi:DNA-directed RNA polymerase subunit RPC12/RpoP
MLFEFKCKECNELFEKLMSNSEKDKITDGKEVECPYCKKNVKAKPLIGTGHFARFWDSL